MTLLLHPLKVGRGLLNRVLRNGSRSASTRHVRFGSFRRTSPLDRWYGWSRGLPVDRYYIERFLAAHVGDVRGRVLEVGDDVYTRRFGDGRITSSDVLHARDGNPRATMVGDLTRPDGLSADRFDCVILTQTLPFIYDVRAAVQGLYRILRPGGVVLATVPGISQIIRKDMQAWGDFWRFTNLSARQLFGDVFGPSNVTVEAHGNVLVAMAFLYGLATCDLRPAELDHRDPDYEVLIAIRALKPVGGPARSPENGSLARS